MTLLRIYGNKCGVVRQGRPPCKLAAGHGTDHLGFGPCKYHGGNIPESREKQGRAMAEFNARQQLAQLGEVVEADPEQALLDLVSQSAALISFYGEQVVQLAQKEKPEHAGPRSAGAFWADYQAGSGLFGPEIDVDKDGNEHVVGEQLRGMVILWNEERDRLAKYARAALAAGIDKRRVAMAERYGESVVVVVNNVLVGIGISGDQLAEARRLVAAEFRQLAAGEDTT